MAEQKKAEPCHCCGRVVKFRYAYGNSKARHRHKCPHGEWCITGDKNLGLHANRPRCPRCISSHQAQSSVRYPPTIRTKVERDQINLKITARGLAADRLRYILDEALASFFGDDYVRSKDLQTMRINLPDWYADEVDQQCGELD